MGPMGWHLVAAPDPKYVEVPAAYVELHDAATATEATFSAMPVSGWCWR